MRKYVLSMFVMLLLMVGSISAVYSSPAIDIEEEMTSIIDAYKEQGSYDDWAAAADFYLGVNQPQSYKDSRIDLVTTNEGKFNQATDLAKVVLGLSASGIDIRDIEGYDLVEEMGNFDPAKLTLNNQAVYMMIALDAGLYNTPDGSTITRQFMIDKLVNDFDITTTGDMLGMFLMTLAPYADQPHVKAELDAGVEALKGKQFDNSSSLALAIAGLSTYGVDPTSADFYQNGKSAIEDLLEYKDEDGSYKWKKTDAAGNQFSNKDVMIALVNYHKFLNGKNGSIFYDIYKPSVPVEEVTVTVEVESPDQVHAGLPVTATVTMDKGLTAFDALKEAIGEENITYSVHPDFGIMLEGILGLENTIDYSKYWSFYINDVSAEVGASGYTVKDGDTLKFSYYVEPEDDSDPATAEKITATVEVESPDQVHAGLPVTTTVTMDKGLTAFDALKEAVGEENIAYSVHPEFGIMLEGILGLENTIDYSKYWSFYINDVSAEVGAGGYTVKDGDTLKFSYYVEPEDDSDSGDSGSGSGSGDGGGPVGGSSPAAKINVKVTFTSEVKYTGFPFSKNVELDEGATVLEALLAAEDDVEYSGSGATAYVYDIKGLEEGMFGALSGWTYELNGVLSETGVGVQTLNDGDEIKWIYVGENPSSGDHSGDSSNSTDTHETVDEQPEPEQEITNEEEEASNRTSEPIEFSDRHEVSSWATQAVQRVQQLGIFSGRVQENGERVFDPKGTTTRAEVAKVLTSLLFPDLPEENDTGFDDVKQAAWYTKYINKAKQEGLITGYADGTFRPNASITRKDLAVIIARALNLEPSSANPFKDVKEDYATKYINAVYEHGILFGTGSESFSPDEPVTREMLSLIVVRIYDNFINNTK